MSGNNDYETGNATVNAMFRDSNVRMKVDTAYAEQRIRLDPATPLKTASQLRDIDNILLGLTAPAAVADALEYEVERLKAEVDLDV